MFIQSKPLCSTWNGGNAVQGLVNIGSTAFDIVFDPVLAVDRNYPNQWTAYDEGWEFVPNSGTSYVISQIPYVPIVAGQNIWTSAVGDTLGYGPTLPVNISSTTTYYADVVGSCSSGILSDDVTVTGSGCFDITLSASEAACLGNDGEIIVNASGGTPGYSFSLLEDGATISTSDSGVFSNLSSGNYSIIVSDLINCSDTINNIILTEAEPLSISNFNIDNIATYCLNNGTISIEANGSCGIPYTFCLYNSDEFR